MNQKRVKVLHRCEYSQGPVLYWMSRDQRIQDNWALIFAKDLARKYNTYFAIVFNIVPDFLGATWRQYAFMIEGLREVEEECRKLHIPLYVLTGLPEETISDFVKKYAFGALVTDFSPLKVYTSWYQTISRRIEVPIYQVDAHNVVPCWEASTKQEFSARTFRPRLHARLDEFLDEFPRITIQQNVTASEPMHWDALRQKLHINFSIKPVHWLKAGTGAGMERLHSFIEERLVLYATVRNDPTKDAQSNLSSFLHFGQIAPQRVALEVSHAPISQNAIDVFLEELLVRRELADNFCFYNQQYDAFEGFHIWARTTLNEHRHDEREYVYSLGQLEQAKTHDPLWNAAQKEMLETGKMHGFLRMYWAKKILEWTESPEHALQFAILLNDRYSLDGRDPNGYTGIAWSIGGVHDRAWTERPIFGKIRYMNFNGCKRKFDVRNYISMHT